MQTLLWALNDIYKLGRKVTIYTDSQNIIGLLGRRNSLEKNDFSSKNHKLLDNHQLYKEFYRLIDNIDCNFMQVKGHQKSTQKNDIVKLFTLVDRASRNALRNMHKGL
jgi:ribonuclease HI